MYNCLEKKKCVDAATKFCSNIFYLLQTSIRKSVDLIISVFLHKLKIYKTPRRDKTHIL